MAKQLRGHWDGKDYVVEVPYSLSDDLFLGLVEKMARMHRDRIPGLPPGDRRDEAQKIALLFEAWCCREFEYRRLNKMRSREHIARWMASLQDMKELGEILSHHNIVQRISNTSDGIGKTADAVLFKATERETSKAFSFGGK